jgi:hypothetical protein
LGSFVGFKTTIINIRILVLLARLRVCVGQGPSCSRHWRSDGIIVRV